MARNTFGNVTVHFDSESRLWKLRSCDKYPALNSSMQSTLTSLEYSFGQDGHGGTLAMIVSKDDECIVLEFEMLKKMLLGRMSC